MKAALIIKTANGYVIVPNELEALQGVDFSKLRVATEIGNRYSSSQQSVLDALRDIFSDTEAS